MTTPDSVYRPDEVRRGSTGRIGEPDIPQFNFWVEIHNWRGCGFDIAELVCCCYWSAADEDRYYCALDRTRKCFSESLEDRALICESETRRNAL